MRILYDGQFLRWQRIGGISNYFKQIIHHLPEDWEPTVLGLDCSTIDIPRHPRLKISAFSNIRPRRLTQPLKRAYWVRHLARKAMVVHPTYYGLTAGLRYDHFRSPVVVTVYDFITATYPQLEEFSGETLRLQREAIERADHIICISSFTEQELLKRHPQTIGKTSVIHLGATTPIFPHPMSADFMEVPSFIFVGGRGGYKNFQLLLRSFSKACESHPTIRLHVAGSPLNSEERWQIYFLGISDRVDISAYPDEASLHELYRRSAALLYPSIHEGFGIPPLEAMACGTIPVTSNTTSLPEVVGAGGIMLAPFDEDAWTECILSIARGNVHRQEMLDLGKRQCSNLTWERSALKHLAVYKLFE